jgi:signal transduction histidine kinase
LHAEGWYTNLGGKDRYLVFDAAPIYDPNGKVIAAIETLQDITKRKKTEEKLQRAFAKIKETQNQLIQAEKLNAIGQLASGVAHEVRNPLGVILQGVNYLENKISKKGKNFQEILTMLKESVKKTNKIMNDLLDFSKATSLSLQPEDINFILESSLSLIKGRLKFVNIEFILETKKDIPLIWGDKNKLEQVFINILLNAAQAMPEGGKIIIRSYDEQLEEVKNSVGKRETDNFKVGERVAMIEIEDTGIGIPEENLPKVFNPFFTTNGSVGGSGLGLSICRNIIDIKSQLGKGTKVIIILKIAEEQ